MTHKNTAPKNFHTHCGVCSHSCCNTFGTERRCEMWNTYKCHRNDHRDGLNADEKLFLKKKVLFQMFHKCCAFKTLPRFISDLWIFQTTLGSDLTTAAFQSQGAWPDRSMREGHSRFYSLSWGLHNLIGWYMSVLLNSGLVFSHAQSMACSLLSCPDDSNQTANSIPETSGRLHISSVKLL